MFSGVYWHLQNVILEDIDRIEVIRGPGATVWGANAVNGVINITTKKTVDTQGGLLVADSGSGRPAEGSLRFGGALGNNAFYRVFGRQTTRNSLPTSSGLDGGDSWNLTNGGFRLDWNGSRSNSITVDAGSYRGVIGSRQSLLTSISPLTFETAGLSNNSGGHILGRWNHSFKNSSNLTVQGYYDLTRRGGFETYDVRTFDLDVQYGFKTGGRNNVMLGFGRRDYADNITNTLSLGMTQPHGNTDVTNGFVQDEITLIKNKLYLDVGTKVEHSSLAGNNLQPSVHLSWLPTARHSAWVSVSRAVRTANRAERGAYFNYGTFPAGQLPGLIYVYGQNDSRSETLNAYEAGYRYQAGRKLWLDATSFYNVYDHLSGQNQGAPFFDAAPAPHLVLPLYIGNPLRGETYGSEAAANYKVTSALTMKASYSFLRLALHSTNGAGQAAEGQSPQHQVSFGSSLNLPMSFDIAGNAYFVSSLPTYKTPAYTRLDMNIGWKGLESLEFQIVGQNLLGSHGEFGDAITPANIVKRSVFGRVTWKF
jgi:iron complex outermembrane receptor protein